MEAYGIMIMLLWGLMSLLVMAQYAPFCKELPFIEKAAVGIIFIIGGPFFVMSNVLEIILGCFLPEGWDNDEPK